MPPSTKKANAAAVPRSRYLVFVVIASAGLAADLATKQWMFDWLGPPVSPTYWVWRDVLGFQTQTNRGALFGIGSGWPLMPYVTSALSIIAAVAIVLWLFVYRAGRDLLLTVALSCVTAGILGNLYDRLGLGLLEDGKPVHQVRDWILVMIFGYHWPNFNIADSLLVCGAGLVVLHAFMSEGPKKAAGQAGQPLPNVPGAKPPQEIPG